MSEFVEQVAAESQRDERIDEAKKRAWRIFELWDADVKLENVKAHPNFSLRDIIEMSVECGMQATIGYRETFEIEAANA